MEELTKAHKQITFVGQPWKLGTTSKQPSAHAYNPFPAQQELFYERE
jgi:hypothetical protein